MKYFLALCFFFTSYLQLYSQLKDKLIVSRDTLSCQIKIDQKKGDFLISYKDINSVEWNVIYANNAAAVYKGNSLYLSLKLPEKEGKIWVKCFFDGVYQLIQYHSLFYIVSPNGIVKLRPNDDIDANGGKASRNSFIGQMINTFYNKIEYDFKRLSYNPKVLVLPFINTTRTIICHITIIIIIQNLRL